MATEIFYQQPTDVLYYEGHITLEPFEIGQQGWLEATIVAACSIFDMRLSTFLMVKEGQQPDAFVSLRSDSYDDMRKRMSWAGAYLRDKGHTIKRYKIEVIVMDSRKQDDPWGLMVPR